MCDGVVRSELTHRRCIALQLGDKYKITTPVNWKTGDDVIVHPSVNNEEAKTLFPDVTFHKVGVLPAAAEASEAHEGTTATVPPDHPAQGVKPDCCAVRTRSPGLSATEELVRTCKSTVSTLAAVPGAMYTKLNCRDVVPTRAPKFVKQSDTKLPRS